MAPEERRQETPPLILEYDDVIAALTLSLCLCVQHVVLLVITVSVRIECSHEAAEVKGLKKKGVE